MPPPLTSLQPVAVDVIDSTPLDFVTIMRTDGTRITHPDPDQIGETYRDDRGRRRRRNRHRGVHGHTRPVGAQRRADPGRGEVIGLVAAGVTVDSLWGQVWQRLPFVIGVAIVLAGIGAAAAWMASRLTRQIAGDLPASAVRDAVSSYESVRTLGEALRAQTHEHGNRMHTAVALIELGRGDEAVELLTETARSSQELVDQVVARDGDPTVAALLLGKASQAKERGVEWRTVMQPGIPRTTLGPVDAVSLVGNLIDNGIDAAAAGPEPRWVEVGHGAVVRGPHRADVPGQRRRACPPSCATASSSTASAPSPPASRDEAWDSHSSVRSSTRRADPSSWQGSPTTFRVTLPAKAPA